MKQIWPLITLSAHSRPPLPSLFSLIMGETDLSSQNKGQCLFFCRPFTSGVFLRVRVLAPLMYNTPTFSSAAPRTELSAPSTKACWEEGRREEYKGEEKCFLSFSINSLQLIVLARSFSSALIWANHLTWQWTFELQHTPDLIWELHLKIDLWWLSCCFCCCYFLPAPAVDHKEIVKLFFFFSSFF